MNRLLRSEMHTFETAILNRIVVHMAPTTLDLIDELLASEERTVPNSQKAANKQDVGFAQLRLDPGRPSMDTVFQELAKLNRIRGLRLPAEELSAQPPKWLEKFRLGYAPESSASPLRAGGGLLWKLQHEIIDGLIDLLIQIVHKIGAETKVEREMLEDIRRVHGKTNFLLRLAEVAIDQPDGVVKKCALHCCTCSPHPKWRCGKTSRIAMDKGR